MDLKTTLRGERERERENGSKGTNLSTAHERYFQYSHSDAKFKISTLLIQTLIQHSWLTATTTTTHWYLAPFQFQFIHQVFSSYQCRLSLSNATIKSTTSDWYKYIFFSIHGERGGNQKYINIYIFLIYIVCVCACVWERESPCCTRRSLR